MLDRREFLIASGLLVRSSAQAGGVAATVENGFLCSAGVSADGWYAGIVVLDHGEAAFCAGLADPGRWACRYDGGGYETELRKAQRWRASLVSASQRLVFRSRGNPTEDRRLATAERILGPAAPREATSQPALIWLERAGGIWRLQCFDGREIRTVCVPPRRLRRPAIAEFGDAHVIACEVDAPGQEVLLISAGGEVKAHFTGGRPRLVRAGDGLLLLVERSTADAISTHLVELDGKLRVKREAVVPAKQDYTWKGDMVHDSATRRAHVVVESSPAFGVDEQLNRTRDLYCWQWDVATSRFQPAGTDNRIPVACSDAAAIEPRIAAFGERPSVSYRQYRVSPIRGTYGWDVWTSELEEAHWQSPYRVTESYGTADTGYEILRDGARTIGVFPCRSHLNGGHITARYWTEVVELPRRSPSAAPPPTVPCSTGAAARRIVIEPEPVGGAPPGLRLIWADLHRHTAYSTCQAATNGMPEDHLRFVRDVLGCQVLTLTEHGHHMTGAESTYVHDRVEEYAGEHGIVLYGDEPNPEPGRHTIFYTTRREVFEQLRTIFLSHGRARPDVYRHIREALPEGAVLAITHFHGKPLPPDAMKAAFSPGLDVAMEAMQIRGNVMLQLHRESNGLLFPNDCLDMGLRVGLVGGTDHTYAVDQRRNHYCLTGLWVSDVSADGVFEALRARRTTAMSDGKLALWAECQGRPMGSEIEASGKIGIDVKMSCGRNIRRAALLRDGRIVEWVPVGAKRQALTLEDQPSPGFHWYVVTVEMETAYGTPGIAHASPFFVDAR